MTELAPSILAAYRATEYRVTGVGTPFVLHIDVPSTSLAAFHATSRVACSAFLTAFNPASVLQSVAVNVTAQRRLEEWLSATGFAWVDAIGDDPAGKWSAEPSVLVPGLDHDVATRLAREFGQNAFLWAGADALPRLVLLR